MRLRAQIRGPAAACIHMNVKQEPSQVQAVPKDEYQARIHLIAYQSEGVPQIRGIQNRPHPATVGSHTIVITTTGCRFSKQKRAPGPGRHNWFEPSTQGTQLTRGSLRGSFTPLTSNPPYANRGHAKSRCHNTARGGRYPTPAF